ncbi:uncharacterized protein LOC105226205 isoform X2 [Bactrocera dorsalis]|uniref:Uncharacterized protein LOC105226205 isoform X2 n=2 Tax=Bactrocera dorsalis TaxID=27457 RepID=A0A8N4QGK1_BACDO|nr:uncharacterized protein LOC105226205 isoform X2 [Bactrocera dorsalis]
MRRYREIRNLKNDFRQKSNQVLNSFTDKSLKMSDWGDEDDGRGFGNGCSQYKENGDDEYVDNGEADYTELQNTDDGNKDFGSRRGRGGGRGRGGRDDRNGGSYGGGRRNFEDNEDNAQPPEFQSTAQNFVPNNFMRATIQEFLPEVPGRIQATNNIDELYCIVKYLLEAYKVCLSTEMITNNTSSDNASTEEMVVRNGNNRETQQEKFDIDQENSNVIENVRVDTTPNENVDISHVIDEKRKAHYKIQLSKNIDLATINQSKLSDLPDLFKDVISTSQDQETPMSTTSMTPFKRRKTNCNVNYNNLGAGIARIDIIPNKIRGHITEREYALRKPLPMRNCLKIVPKDLTLVNIMRKMTYNFFPLEDILANAASPGMHQIVPFFEDHSQLEEGSAGTSTSINVARQHVTASSISGLPSIQLVRSHSGGLSMQILNEQFNTPEEISDFLPRYTENSGQQKHGDILPESSTDITFLTPYPTTISAGILSRSDEDQLKSVKKNKLISGPLLPQRAEPSTSRTGTLPSIREEEFRRTLIRRTVRNSDISSTPLRPLDGIALEGRDIPHFQSYANEGSTELISGGNIQSTEAGIVSIVNQDVQTSAIGVSKAFESVEQTSIIQSSLHQKVVERKTDKTILPSGSLLHVQIPEELDTLNEPRNWLEVLRERQVDLQYNKFGILPKKRKRCHKRRAPQNLKLTQACDFRVSYQTNNTEILQALSPLPSQLPVPLESTADVTHIRNLNNVHETQFTVVEQPSYEQFVYEHIESISTIMDNLVEWQSVLKACNRNSETNTSTALLPAYYAYDVETLLKADIARLQLKMNLLQAIIRNVSFNVMKSRLLKNRSLAAVAFNFLIELESAGIIRIKEHGHWVELI